jgi:formylmethanofuran dehydrogenase subunit E
MTHPPMSAAPTPPAAGAPHPAAAEALPEFYAAAPCIRVHDPLADFLGAAADGVLDYGYDDAVRLAGHSCPTVASAWLMTRAALAALYPGALAERGGIAVELREPADAGVTGVVARVVALVTGAAGDDGFKGIAGRFVRRGRLQFGARIDGELRLARRDDGRAVEVSARLDRVPGDPRLRELMARALADAADAEARRALGAAWQARVRRLLLDHADDPEVIVVRTVPAAGRGGAG